MSLIILDLVYDRRMAGRPKANLELTETQRQELEGMARAGSSEKRMVFRARLILECATGADNVQVAKTLGTSQQTVTFWRGRFLREGRVINHRIQLASPHRQARRTQHPSWHLGNQGD